MTIEVGDNGNVVGYVGSDGVTGMAPASADGVLTVITFSDATGTETVLSMKNVDAIAGPASTDSEGNVSVVVFDAPLNSPQASGTVSHCGENGISNGSDYWSGTECSADCSGSFYAQHLEDNCQVCLSLIHI